MTFSARMVPYCRYGANPVGRFAPATGRGRPTAGWNAEVRNQKELGLPADGMLTAVCNLTSAQKAGSKRLSAKVVSAARAMPHQIERLVSVCFVDDR